MLQNDTNDLTRVGPGTVMGEFMRQYWMPAALSSEVKADGDPVRLMIMCEKLIAFRDSSGRVGWISTGPGRVGATTTPVERGPVEYVARCPCCSSA